MTEPTSINAPTVQAAKAAQYTVLSLLKDIKATKCTSDALKGLLHRLSSVEKGLDSFASGFDHSGSRKLSLEVQHHLRMAIWCNQDACARFHSVFNERTSHSTNNSLHESDWDGFGIFEDIELRLLSERLQVLESTIGTVMEISALLTVFSTSTTICDAQWDLILAKENDLLSAAIEANRRQHAHHDRRMALNRIVCEMEGYNIAMQHPRKAFYGLLSEICRLRDGHGTNTRNEDQLPVRATNAMPGEIRFFQHDGVVSMNRNQIVMLGARDDFYP